MLSQNSDSPTNLEVHWHHRLAHMNSQELFSVHKHIKGVPKPSPSSDSCRACHLGKAHKLPFNNDFKGATKIGEVTHSDIIGRLSMSVPDQYHYVCTFIDGHSRYSYLGLIRRRSNLLNAFSLVYDRLKAYLTTDDMLFGYSTNILKLHSDGAEKYKAVKNPFGGKEFEKSFSLPYTPEHNAIAERINRTLGDVTRSLIVQGNLPPCLRPPLQLSMSYMLGTECCIQLLTEPIFYV